MESLPQIILLDVVYPSQPFYDLQTLFASLLVHPLVKDAFLPVFLGYCPGSGTRQPRAVRKDFEKSFGEFCQNLPEVYFRDLGEGIYGETVPYPARPHCMVNINVELLNKYRIGIRGGTGSRDDGKKLADQSLMLLVGTFAHECGHAYSMWMSSYITPHRLHLGRYVTVMEKEEADEQWVLIKQVERVGEDIKHLYIQSSKNSQNFEIGESGYVVERAVFGGVCTGVLPMTPTTSDAVGTSSHSRQSRSTSTPRSDGSSDFDRINEVLMDLYDGNDDHEDSATVGGVSVEVELELLYLARLRRAIMFKRCLFYPDYLGDAPAHRIDNSLYIRHRKPCRGPDRALIES